MPFQRRYILNLNTSSPTKSDMLSPLPEIGFGDDLCSNYDFLADISTDIDFFSGSFYGVSFENICTSITIDGAMRNPCIISGGQRARRRRTRRANRTYIFESVKESCWYNKFTRPGNVRNQTLQLSGSDRYGDFRNWFRLPLCKVISLTDMFINRGYVTPPRSLSRRAEFRERTELLIMCSLYLLGSGAEYRKCQTLCNISTSEVRKFFRRFLVVIMENMEEYISLPKNVGELETINKYYASVGLPGCCGSMDVVHVKWSNCPAGDYNRAKGKEGYPSLAFQCITDYNRRVLAIYGPHFGTRNDLDIVKTDGNVHKIQTGYFQNVMWDYYDIDGFTQTARGAYLICDNGYLRWPTTICPYVGVKNSTLEGYFSTNLESVRKDVECTFGILKKRWKILNNGIYYRDIVKCDQIFKVCCWLNNYMLDIMDDTTNIRIGRGCPIDNDGLWLSGNNPPTRGTYNEGESKHLAQEFGERRTLLANHLLVFREKGKTLN